MSAKNLDTHNRWRNKTVAFRVSPEENEQIDAAVRLSGLTKQDYITKRLLCRDVVVQGNPRVYKALRDELATVLGRNEGPGAQPGHCAGRAVADQGRGQRGQRAAGHHSDDRRYHGRHEGGLID